METFAAEMRANLRHYSIHPGNYALIIPKQLREHLQAAKWSKTDIANFIHERARIHRREWAEVGKGAVVRDRGDSVYPAMESPDQLLVIAAGGPAGGFGAVIPPWLGNKSHAVTVPIGACIARLHAGVPISVMDVFTPLIGVQVDRAVVVLLDCPTELGRSRDGWRYGVHVDSLQ